MRFFRQLNAVIAVSILSGAMVAAAVAQEAESSSGAAETESAALSESVVSEHEVELEIYDVRTPHLDRPLKVVSLEAPAIGRITKYMVLLPEGYDENPDRHYPVLYMLHGFSQNYTVWPMMGVAQHADKYDLIVVMPDAGNSWYINWAQSEGEELNNWEDFIVYDLIHSVDDYFRTIPSREGRAISGVSMGGYGALMIGLRHPTMFCTVASHSGVIDYARAAGERLAQGEAPKPNEIPPPRDDPREMNVPEVIEIPGFTRQHERYPHGIAFMTVEEAQQYDPFQLITQVPVRYLPHIYLDCGLEDGLLPITQEFAALLMSNNIPFSFSQTPGQHGVNYWSRELAQSMAVQWTVIERNVKLWELKKAQQEAAQAGQAPQMQHDHSQQQPAAPQTPQGGDAP